MRVRRETLEHPFGTMKARMGATHFLTKTLPKVVTEMALSVLAYNLTGVMNIVGTRALIAAIEAQATGAFVHLCGADAPWGTDLECMSVSRPSDNWKICSKPPSRRCAGLMATRSIPP